MKIELQKIKISDLINGYFRDEESGQVMGYGRKLNIRPKYQREFVYGETKRNAVIETLMRGFPLNSFYWAKQSETGYEPPFEVLDGQQRTISISDYCKGNFSVGERYFHNLSKTEQEQILNYELFVYVCDGNDKEKLEWFKTINIAGEQLSDQELRNAVYTSAWLSDAKLRFSKHNCVAYQKGKDYLSGTPIRQEYLETAIKWITAKDYEKVGDDKAICEYMARAAKDFKNADELWGYFSAVIDWVSMKFPHYRREMKGLAWGAFYNEFKDKKLDKNELEMLVAQLMQDDEITNKRGIYAYALSGNEKHLSLRAFTHSQKRECYERQGGICKICGEHFELEKMEADHITPWSAGGKTEPDNCQMLCVSCNRMKSDR